MIKLRDVQFTDQTAKFTVRGDSVSVPIPRDRAAEDDIRRNFDALAGAIHNYVDVLIAVPASFNGPRSVTHGLKSLSGDAVTPNRWMVVDRTGTPVIDRSSVPWNSTVALFDITSGSSPATALIRFWRE